MAHVLIKWKMKDSSVVLLCLEEAPFSYMLAHVQQEFQSNTYCQYILHKITTHSYTSLSLSFLLNLRQDGFHPKLSGSQRIWWEVDNIFSFCYSSTIIYDNDYLLYLTESFKYILKLIWSWILIKKDLILTAKIP